MRLLCQLPLQLSNCISLDTIVLQRHIVSLQDLGLDISFFFQLQNMLISSSCPVKKFLTIVAFITCDYETSTNSTTFTFTFTFALVSFAALQRLVSPLKIHLLT